VKYRACSVSDMAVSKVTEAAVGFATRQRPDSGEIASHAIRRPNDAQALARF